MQTANYKKITKESYQSTAEEFARNVDDLAPTGSIEKFIKLLPPKAKIIDIGCGSGRDAKLFTNMGATVLGIDFSSNLIDIAKRKAPLAEFQLNDIKLLIIKEKLGNVKKAISDTKAKAEMKIQGNHVEVRQELQRQVREAMRMYVAALTTTASEKATLSSYRHPNGFKAHCMRFFGMVPETVTDFNSAIEKSSKIISSLSENDPNVSPGAKK
jgi:SAM-dependent methyltransferase